MHHYYVTSISSLSPFRGELLMLIGPQLEMYTQDEYRSTRTHVNSYPCQLVPMSTRTTNIFQLVPHVMSTCTQQGKYQMMVRVDIYYHTINVNSYTWLLVPMSTRTTKRCQLVPQVTTSDVNSHPIR